MYVPVCGLQNRLINLFRDVNQKGLDWEMTKESELSGKECKKIRALQKNVCHRSD